MIRSKCQRNRFLWSCVSSFADGNEMFLCLIFTLHSRILHIEHCSFIYCCFATSFSALYIQYLFGSHCNFQIKCIPWAAKMIYIKHCRILYADHNWSVLMLRKREFESPSVVEDEENWKIPPVDQFNRSEILKKMKLKFNALNTVRGSTCCALLDSYLICDGWAISWNWMIEILPTSTITPGIRCGFENYLCIFE